MTVPRVYSMNIYLRELFHILVFAVAGFCPWFRPWNWVLIILYVWFKEGYWDPSRTCGKTWWKVQYGEAFYTWGEGKWINFKSKGILDAVVCIAGGLLGTVLYHWLIGG